MSKSTEGMWHLSPVTGQPERCGAKAGGCPYGGDPNSHYATREEAQIAYEKKNERVYGLFSTLRGDCPVAEEPVYYDTPEEAAAVLEERLRKREAGRESISVALRDARANVANKSDDLRNALRERDLMAESKAREEREKAMKELDEILDSSDSWKNGTTSYEDSLLSGIYSEDEYAAVKEGVQESRAYDNSVERQEVEAIHTSFETMDKELEKVSLVNDGYYDYINDVADDVLIDEDSVEIELAEQNGINGRIVGSVNEDGEVTDAYYSGYTELAEEEVDIDPNSATWDMLQTVVNEEW